MEKINKYDPFSDEVEYSFYTHLLNFKEKISPEILEKIINKNKEESQSKEEDTVDILEASGIIWIFKNFSRKN